MIPPNPIVTAVLQTLILLFLSIISFFSPILQGLIFTDFQQRKNTLPSGKLEKQCKQEYYIVICCLFYLDISRLFQFYLDMIQGVLNY